MLIAVIFTSLLAAELTLALHAHSPNPPQLLLCLQVAGRNWAVLGNVLIKQVMCVSFTHAIILFPPVNRAHRIFPSTYAKRLSSFFFYKTLNIFFFEKNPFVSLKISNMFRNRIRNGYGRSASLKEFSGCGQSWFFYTHAH